MYEGGEVGVPMAYVWLIAYALGEGLALRKYVAKVISRAFVIEMMLGGYAAMGYWMVYHHALPTRVQVDAALAIAVALAVVPPAVYRATMPEGAERRVVTVYHLSMYTMLIGLALDPLGIIPKGYGLTAFMAAGSAIAFAWACGFGIEPRSFGLAVCAAGLLMEAISLEPHRSFCYRDGLHCLAGLVGFIGSLWHIKETGRDRPITLVWPRAWLASLRHRTVGMGASREP